MSLDADAIVDRRRLKRRLIAWRLAAIVAVAALAYVALFPLQIITGRDHVASMQISGLITDDQTRLNRLGKIARNERIKALVVRINSPGGTAVGGETLYHALRRVADQKPVVALIRTMGASGGYMAALAADRIYARETSLTGSIGVVLQTAEMSGLLEKIGVTAETLASGPLKAQPSAFAPMTDQARAATQGLIDDTHKWFVNLVSLRRNLSAEEANSAADGRLFTGRQALGFKLIDEVGGLLEARTWLHSQGVSNVLPMQAIETTFEDAGWLRRMLGSAGNSLLSERLTLDGLLTLWQPDSLF